jgi:hypothetical protein
MNKTEPPYNIKLHVQNEVAFELSEQEIRESMHAYVQSKVRDYFDQSQMTIEVKFFPAKR